MVRSGRVCARCAVFLLSRTLSPPAKGSASPWGANRREHSISDHTVAAAVQYIERCGQGDQARFPIILGHGQDNRLELKQRPAHAPSLWSTLKTSVSRRLVPEYVQQEWKDYTLYLWPKESTLPKSKLPNPYQDKTLGWYLYNREMNLSKGMVRSSDPLNEAPFVDLLKWQCSDQTVLSLNNLAKKLGNLKGRHRNKASYYAAVVLKVQIPRHSLDASKSRKARSPNEVLGTIVNIQPDRKNLEYVGMSNNRGGYRRTPYCILPEPEPSDS